MNNGDRWWVMTFDEYRKGIDGLSWEDNKREREQTEYRQEFEVILLHQWGGCHVRCQRIAAPFLGKGVPAAQPEEGGAGDTPVP